MDYIQRPKHSIVFSTTQPRISDYGILTHMNLCKLRETAPSTTYPPPGMHEVAPTMESLQFMNGLGVVLLSTKHMLAMMLDVEDEFSHISITKADDSDSNMSPNSNTKLKGKGQKQRKRQSRARRYNVPKGKNR